MAANKRIGPYDATTKSQTAAFSTKLRTRLISEVPDALPLDAIHKVVVAIVHGKHSNKAMLHCAFAEAI
jgi:hypothetical protein